VNDRADGDGKLDRSAFRAGLVAALAVTAALGFVLRIVAVAKKRVLVLAGDHDDIASAPAIAAAGPAFRNVLLPAEGEASVTAVAGLHQDSGFVNKHRKAAGRFPTGG